MLWVNSCPRDKGAVSKEYDEFDRPFMKCINCGWRSESGASPDPAKPLTCNGTGSLPAPGSQFRKGGGVTTAKSYRGRCRVCYRIVELVTDQRVAITHYPAKDISALKARYEYDREQERTVR